ncbi:MAG TPA: polymer-forming cytoskeletal protein [Gemmatimonadales bacterium]|nr:polymer-forming cytoskeletal protein [Gemmatimonadales bacterium]
MKRNTDAREAGLSIIAPGMRIEGQVSSNGVVKVEGTVVGAVQADQQVLVASGGTVEGDVRTREAIVGGTVHGSIFADERVEIQPGAVVRGDITTFRILVSEGGEVNGLLRMSQADELMGKPPTREALSTH